MSEKDQTQENLKDTSKSLKNGDEPTELLLQLVWSPTETLINRGIARVLVGNNSVAVVLKNTKIDPERGLVPTVSETVGIEEER